MSVDFPEPVRPTNDNDKYRVVLRNTSLSLTYTNALSSLDAEADVL